MAIQKHIQHDHHIPEMPVFVDMLNRMNEPDVASDGSGLNGGWASMTLERSNHILLDQVPHTGHTEGSC